MRQRERAWSGLLLATLLGATGLSLADGSRRLERAIEAYEAQRIEEARGLLESLLADEPYNARALWNRGLLSMHDGDPDEAIGWFDRAIAADDTDAEYHLWRGYAYTRKVQTVSLLRKPFLARKILASFQRAVELAPRNVKARRALMRYYDEAPFWVGGSARKARLQAEAIAEIEREAAEGTPERDLGAPRQ
jgi:tetratricopeptide (TPR) repeat protein